MNILNVAGDAPHHDIVGLITFSMLHFFAVTITEFTYTLLPHMLCGMDCCKTITSQNGT